MPGSEPPPLASITGRAPTSPWTVTFEGTTSGVEVTYGAGGSPPSRVTSSLVAVLASLIAVSIEQGSVIAHGDSPSPPTSAKRFAALAGAAQTSSAAQALSAPTTQRDLIPLPFSSRTLCLRGRANQAEIAPRADLG